MVDGTLGPEGMKCGGGERRVGSHVTDPLRIHRESFLKLCVLYSFHCIEPCANASISLLEPARRRQCLLGFHMQVKTQRKHDRACASDGCDTVLQRINSNIRLSLSNRSASTQKHPLSAWLIRTHFPTPAPSVVRPHRCGASPALT